MAVKYTVSKNTNSKSAAFNKYYARAKHTGTVDLRSLADRIQTMCTATRGDVMVVLDALVNVMKSELGNSNRVKLDGFGTFKIGLTSTGSMTRKAFSAQNIVGTHVIFSPETHIEKNGVRVKSLLEGVKVQEYDEYSKE